jgi:hypothetical protein
MQANITLPIMSQEASLEQKSLVFALRLILVCEHLVSQNKNQFMIKQLLQIGQAISKSSTLDSAEKNVQEAHYWLRLCQGTNLVADTELKSLLAECEQLKTLLIRANRKRTNIN